MHRGSNGTAFPLLPLSLPRIFGDGGLGRGYLISRRLHRELGFLNFGNLGFREIFYFFCQKSIVIMRLNSLVYENQFLLTGILNLSMYENQFSRTITMSDYENLFFYIYARLGGCSTRP